MYIYKITTTIYKLEICVKYKYLINDRRNKYKLSSNIHNKTYHNRNYIKI